MTLQKEEPAVRLKNHSSTTSTGYHAAGLLTLISIPMVKQAIDEGISLSGLFFPGVTLIALALAKISEKSNALDFVILYSDRIEIPESRDSFRIVHWDQVTELRWFGAHSGSLQLRIYTDEFKSPLGFFQMDLSNLNAEDRLVFIRYVRKSATAIEQRNWSNFCRNTAIPLIEKVERQENLEKSTDAEPLCFREKFVIKGLELIVVHPYFATLFLPVTALFIFSLIASRRTSLTVACMIAISSFINIRLMWGQWLEPFTTICLSFAAVFAILGFLALSRKPETSDSQQSLNTTKVLGYFTFFLVGVPFAANGLAKGWLPNNFAQPLKWLSLILLLAPFFLLNMKQLRHEKNTRDQSEKEALDRWEAYEALKS